MTIPAVTEASLPSVIFLDAVGTLFGIRGSVGSIYGEFAHRAGVSVDPEVLDRAFIISFQAAPSPDWGMKDPTVRVEQEFAWWQAIAAQSFQRVGVYEQFADFTTFFVPLFDYFATAAPWFVYPDVRAALTYWQLQGVELGLLSNFDSRLYSVLEVLDLASFFTSVTLSTEVGAAKPDPAIFQAALAKHRINPGGVWHIGDSWTDDVKGAEAAGLKGFWLKRERPLPPDPPVLDPGIPTISSLTALLPVSPPQS